MKPRLLVIPVLSSLLLGACTIPFIGNTVDNVKQAAEDKAMEQEMIKNCKFDTEVCKYMAASVTSMSKPMIITSETTVKGYGKSTNTSINDGKGNMQITSYKDGKEDSNMIILDKITYTKEYKDNYWLEMKPSDDDAENSVVDMNKITEEFKSDISEEVVDDTVFTKVGEEACGKLMCHKYSMYSKETPKDVTTIWFDTKDYLARKMEININGSLSTTVYEYDNVPAITKPSPVKEFKLDTMDSLYEGKTGVPSQAEIDKMLEDLPPMEETPYEGE